MYSDVFCRVYNTFGWNYYPETFAEQLLQWLREKGLQPRSALDLACGTGILCETLREAGIRTRGMDLSEGMIAIARERCPEIPYDVADMVTYCPGESFDLVTCTGDAVNHIRQLQDVQTIFRNVHGYLNPGGYFVFDLLNEREVSGSEPFEMDMEDGQRIWFQMTRPEERQVVLTIQVWERETLQFRQVIRETLHDPTEICTLLEQTGLRVIRCADRMLEDGGHGTTWFLIAQKP